MPLNYATNADGAMYNPYKNDHVMSDDVIDAADFQAAFRNNIPKRLARALSAPITTARALVYRGVWPSRRREIALVLVEQIRKEQQQLALVEAKLTKILEEYEDNAAGRQGNKGNSATVLPDGGMAHQKVGVVVRPERAGNATYPRLYKTARR